jgi:hypothetical protein
MASVRNRRRDGKFRILLAFLTGVASIVVGVLLHQQHQPYANGVSTTGTVSGVRDVRTHDAVLHARVFTFTTSNGRKVTVTESESRSTRPDLGSSVTVSYLKSDPDSARIVETSWVPFGFIAVGVVTALATLKTLVSRRAD